MSSKANAQKAPVQWPKEIAKSKLSQAKLFFHRHIFIKTMKTKMWKKRDERKRKKEQKLIDKKTEEDGLW